MFDQLSRVQLALCGRPIDIVAANLLLILLLFLLLLLLLFLFRFYNRLFIIIFLFHHFLPLLLRIRPYDSGTSTADKARKDERADRQTNG